MELTKHKYFPLVIVAVQPHVFVYFSFGILLLRRIDGPILELEKLATKHERVVTFPPSLARFASRCALPVADEELQRVPRRFSRVVLCLQEQRTKKGEQQSKPAHRCTLEVREYSTVNLRICAIEAVRCLYVERSVPKNANAAKE